MPGGSSCGLQQTSTGAVCAHASDVNPTTIAIGTTHEISLPNLERRIVGSFAARRLNRALRGQQVIPAVLRKTTPQFRS
jgi:hypothetical protein